MYILIPSPMKTPFAIFSLSFILSTNAWSQAIITVDASAGHVPISPWIYGKNNNLSDDPGNPVSATTWQLYKDAGLRMFRENGGNNSTKYNWRSKLSSHPDWYNNVYDHSWDYSAASLLSNTTNTQGLYAFQLLGKVASNKNNNFNDWAYTQANGYINMDKNWAGGGGPSAYGGNNGIGNPDLYLKNWPADSAVSILDHWFNTLALDKSQLMYWNMDNEPDIWSGTHDDVDLPASPITAEQFMQRYFAVAKAARAKYPDIKLVGPVTANEWQWYNWNNGKVTDTSDNKSYPWMQYFIKRVAEEQLATGIRLLDVLDIHFYPSTANDPATTLQLHRVWFDTLYNYPNANGVKVTGTGGWDNNITKEYFFERCNRWMNQYMGADHKVTFGISEYGATANGGSEDANVVACWYASHLGVFSGKNVELFTPWDWYKGQWEVLHLFSKYFGQVSTTATSTNDNVVSGYSSISSDGDSLMVAIVNRDRTNAQNVTINIQNFVPSQTSVNGYRLSGLPSTETFISKSNNALKSAKYTISNNKITFSAPKLSVTLIQIPANQSTVTGINNGQKPSFDIQVFPNPSKNIVEIKTVQLGGYQVMIQNMMGDTLATLNFISDGRIDLSSYPSGQYILCVTQNGLTVHKKVMRE